jgi:hypothetical protein
MKFDEKSHKKLKALVMNCVDPSYSETIKCVFLNIDAKLESGKKFGNLEEFITTFQKLFNKFQRRKRNGSLWDETWRELIEIAYDIVEILK